MSCCRCGPHISVQGTIYDTILQLDPKVNKCFQCFLGGPQQYNTRTIPQNDADKSREYLDRHKMQMVVHAPYVINLAREGDESIITKSKNSLQKVINELHKIGPDYTSTVVHIGAKGSIGKLCNELNDLDIKIPVLMENSAGEGSKLGRDIDELRHIVEGTDSSKVGICIDTCHIFAAGTCDLRSMSLTEKLFEDMDFMNNRRLIFHVNDSLTDLGGRVDRHAPIGYGHIWNLNVDGSRQNLERFYELCIMSKSDIIFETPNEFTKKYEEELFNTL